jgi:hypothetical protein
VPSRRQVWSPEVRVSAPLPTFPFFAFLAVGVAAVTLGIVALAVEEVEALAVVKTPQHTSTVLAAQTGAQRDLATAQARLSAARAFLHTEAATRWSAAVAGSPGSDEDRARLRLACAYAATESVSVTRLAFDLGGGSSVFEDSPLQRCLRDVHVAAQPALIAATRSAANVVVAARSIPRPPPVTIATSCCWFIAESNRRHRWPAETGSSYRSRVPGGRLGTRIREGGVVHGDL